MSKSYMVSSDEMREILGEDLKIIRFQQLKEYSNIRQLLPKQRDYCVIFYQDDKQGETNIGHWTALLRYGDYFEFFDPYGLPQSKELSYISADKRALYGESFDYLTKLLKSTVHSYNHYDYQSWESGTNTCGRWAILRIYAFKNGIIDQESFHKLMTSKMQGGRFKTFDDVAVHYTS
jgi:hypothetical protein